MLMQIQKQCFSLHSILVIFHYKSDAVPAARFIAFTFHSGYIPLTMRKGTRIAQPTFTFHSGYIPLFKLRKSWRCCIYTLHSILVIFHYFLASKNDESFSSFTFHSGYIPLQQQNRLTILLCRFTFHSGYIPLNIRSIICYSLLTLHSILVIFHSIT